MTLRVAAFAFLMLPFSAYPQVTLTDAIQFATNSSGTFSENQSWNTLGGDSCWDLWLAYNPDASLPINGLSDAQAGINLSLTAGNSYRFYTFGAPDLSISVNGLNLFFDGNDSTPGISVFGATNSTLFSPNSSRGTRTLAGGVLNGSGSTYYAANGVVVLLTGYTWNVPATPPGDVAQAFAFAPGDSASFFGSFSLHGFPEAVVAISQPSGSPLTALTLTGTGFAPGKEVVIYANGLGSNVLGARLATSTGSLATEVLVPQHPYGPMPVFAYGLSSEKLGVASYSVNPGIFSVPAFIPPGARSQ